ncbi:hypothetical protein D3C86_2165230 [compost metagenome]
MRRLRPAAGNPTQRCPDGIAGRGPKTRAKARARIKGKSKSKIKGEGKIKGKGFSGIEQFID